MPFLRPVLFLKKNSLSDIWYGCKLYTQCTVYDSNLETKIGFKKDYLGLNTVLCHKKLFPMSDIATAVRQSDINETVITGTKCFAALYTVRYR